MCFLRQVSFPTATVLMRFLPLLMGLGLMASASAQAAECKSMNYFDQAGAVVPTSKPIAGFMLAGTPITGPVDVPGAVRREVGEVVACPKELVAEVQKLFDESCFSEDKRKQTAKANNTDIANVNKRCADMGEALHPRQR